MQDKCQITKQCKINRNYISKTFKPLYSSQIFSSQGITRINNIATTEYIHPEINKLRRNGNKNSKTKAYTIYV